ncbi:ankyrin repeat and fibronectin type-III domain-containing protein 1-like isoform X2 [Ptychodera flava]|uniref:ankyrin repeat and fibronectin type-III domain-containing protein 1-like isoform X2 n=1 Tax=Ptychodera flava TaxID=63121 RepID=UPI00396A1D12
MASYGAGRRGNLSSMSDGGGRRRSIDTVDETSLEEAELYSFEDFEHLLSPGADHDAGTDGYKVDEQDDDVFTNGLKDKSNDRIIAMCSQIFQDGSTLQMSDKEVSVAGDRKTHSRIRTGSKTSKEEELLSNRSYSSGDSRSPSNSEENTAVENTSSDETSPALCFDKFSPRTRILKNEHLFKTQFPAGTGRNFPPPKASANMRKLSVPDRPHNTTARYKNNQNGSFTSSYPYMQNSPTANEYQYDNIISMCSDVFGISQDFQINTTPHHPSTSQRSFPSGPGQGKKGIITNAKRKMSDSVAVGAKTVTFVEDFYNTQENADHSSILGRRHERSQEKFVVRSQTLSAIPVDNRFPASTSSSSSSSQDNGNNHGNSGSATVSNSNDNGCGSFSNSEGSHPSSGKSTTPTAAEKRRRKFSKAVSVPTYYTGPGAAWQLGDDVGRENRGSSSQEDLQNSKATIFLNSQPLQAEIIAPSNQAGLKAMVRKPAMPNGDVRKAQSMESLLQPNNNEVKASSIPTSPSAPQRLYRKLSGKRRESLATEIDKLDKERNKKSSRGITDIKALFEAVEHQDIEAAKGILESNGLDINAVNCEEFTVLDIAVMTNNTPMAKLLLEMGARENPRFLLKESRLSRLMALINEAERKVDDLTAAVINPNSTNSTASNSQTKENEKILKEWEWKFRLLKRMKAGFEHARPPECPRSVTLTTASSSSLHVRFEEPTNINGAVITRYKIEWSTSDDFSTPCGEHILYDVRNLFYTIQGLKQGTKYFVRVSAFNMKGFGPFQLSTPPYAIPSSWRDVDGSKPRSSGRLTMIDDLFMQYRNSRPADSMEIKSNSSPRSSPSQVRKTVKKSIKTFFQSAPKFQKNLKRGVYLASLLFNEDRILVTAEDQVPIVEVDENFSNNIHHDFHWLMKVASTWEDVDVLRSEMERSVSSSTVAFRSKLLQAAAQLQNALGIQDLGQLYFQPAKDMNGSLVITTVNYIKDPRIPISLKWSPLARIQKKWTGTPDSDEPSAPDLLMGSIPEKILYHQASTIPLARGLYVGYLKLRSSVDIIRVMVPEKTPNVLPHVKVRDNPNVSREEWELLQQLDSNEVKDPPSSAQLKFQNQLVTATKRLLNRLGVVEEQALNHRICDLEVIDMNEEVSFVLVVPPAVDVCSVPGQMDDMTSDKEHILLPVPVFEMVHMTTYQPEFIRRYARLSSILEMDNLIAQHTLREAFSDDEVSEAKSRINRISEFQQTLDSTWKGMRWIMDSLQYARDKQIKGGAPLSQLYASPPSPVESPNLDKKPSRGNYKLRRQSLVNSETSSIYSTGSDTSSTSGSTTSSPRRHHCDRLEGSQDDTTTGTSASSSNASSPTHSMERINGGTSPTIVQQNSKAGILRVYPAYETGLAPGTSLKLHVTTRTSAREIVNLVVQQLNKAVKIKGCDGPVYSDDKFDDFCLIADIGGKERMLKDDYSPLQLQNPWTKGKLLVKLKDPTIGLLQMGQSTTV